MAKISADQAKEILSNLTGKPAIFSSGFGGYLAGEIGKLKEVKVKYSDGSEWIKQDGEYRLFADESWEITKDGKVIFNRWGEKHEIDKFFESIKGRKIDRVNIIGEFKRIVFCIDDYNLEIIREDSLTTMLLDIIPESRKLRVNGDGTFDLTIIEKNKDDNKPVYKYKKDGVLEISRKFLAEREVDLLPLSVQKTTEFLASSFSGKIKEVQADSGTKFTLRFGEPIDNISRWYLSIEELWTLNFKNDVVLEAKKNAFHFEEELTQLLRESKIEKIEFDDYLNLNVYFSNGYYLSTRDTKRYSKWGWHDYKTGLSIEASRDNKLQFRINVPTRLYGKEPTGDIYLDSMLYELDFYRKYFSE